MIIKVVELANGTIFITPLDNEWLAICEKNDLPFIERDLINNISKLVYEMDESFTKPAKPRVRVQMIDGDNPFRFTEIKREEFFDLDI